jgi:hypothetical protein
VNEAQVPNMVCASRPPFGVAEFCPRKIMNFIGDDLLSTAEMQFKLRAEIGTSCSRGRLRAAYCGAKGGVQITFSFVRRLRNGQCRNRYARAAWQASKKIPNVTCC